MSNVVPTLCQNKLANEFCNVLFLLLFLCGEGEGWGIPSYLLNNILQGSCVMCVLRNDFYILLLGWTQKRPSKSCVLLSGPELICSVGLPQLEGMEENAGEFG